MEKLFEDPFQDQYYKGRKDPGHSKTYYVVFEGHEVAIFDAWEDAELSTKGYSGNKHKSFKNYNDAETALKQYMGFKEPDAEKS